MEVEGVGSGVAGWVVVELDKEEIELRLADDILHLVVHRITGALGSRGDEIIGATKLTQLRNHSVVARRLVNRLLKIEVPTIKDRVAERTRQVAGDVLGTEDLEELLSEVRSGGSIRHTVRADSATD